MNVKVMYRGQLKIRTGCNNEIIDLDPDETMEVLLGTLRDKYGKAIEDILFDNSGQLHPMVLVALNGSQIPGDQKRETVLHDRDEVMFMSPIAGG